MVNVWVLVDEVPITNIEADGSASGIAFEIWNKISTELGIVSNIVPIKTKHEGLIKVESGQVDVLVGPFDITSNMLTKVSFSTPYIINSVGVITRDSVVTPAMIFKKLNTDLLDVTIIYALILLIIFSVLLWLADRNKHEDLRGLPAAQSIGNCMWVMITTLLRDLIYTPATFIGKIIVSMWMIFSVIAMAVVASSITASVISIGTKMGDRYNSGHDLYGKKVAVMENSRNINLAKHFGSKVVIVEHEIDLINLIHDSSVDASIEDKIIAEHLIDISPGKHLHLEKVTIAKDLYSFVFPIDSTLKSIVDKILVRQRSVGGLSHICNKYMKRNAVDCRL